MDVNMTSGNTKIEEDEEELENIKDFEEAVFELKIDLADTLIQKDA